MNKKKVLKYDEIRHCFLHTCNEREVPTDVMMKMLDDMSEFESDQDKDVFLKEKIEDIKRDYPFKSKEQFLRESEDKKNWEYIRARICYYWPDVRVMLPDAVRWGAHNLVDEIAPHCLFNNRDLQNEYLAIAPDEGTRKALTENVMIDREDEYRKYTFCYASNRIFHRWNTKTISCKVLSMPDNLQEEVWQRFLERFVHGSEQEFFRFMYNGEVFDTMPKGARMPYDYEHFLFNLGYELTSDGFVRRQLPDYWIKSEYSNEVWDTDAEKTDAGMTGFLCLMSEFGWEICNDWVNNYFGCTGYSYIKYI